MRLLLWISLLAAVFLPLGQAPGGSAPLLWVQGEGSRLDSYWRGRYSHAEFQQRLAHVAKVQQVALEDAGHMLHHDQPEALAAALLDFLA